MRSRAGCPPRSLTTRRRAGRSRSRRPSAGLQTVVAEPWFKVSDEGLVLEGPAFDREGNLLFCDVSGRRVLRLTQEKRLSTVVNLDKLGPGGLAAHKDGRLFIAAICRAQGHRG